ncbi:MAG TPA: GreA/GreB family elongation factor [Hanamia sp.]|nr:GreA/GreB family elongation factor [Hanamia sp.]
MATATLTPTASPVILLKKDFEILNGYVKNLQGMQVNEKENFRKLYDEIRKAQIVNEENFPDDVVRLDSTVVIKDLQSKRDMRITVVLPQKADIKQKKVSVLAPIGTALIGFRKGQIVSWEVPSGKKDFKIMEVKNSLIPEK